MQPLRLTLCLCVLMSATMCYAQSPDRSEGRQRLIERFDENGDGRLNRDERRAARRFLKSIQGRRTERSEQIPQTIFPGRTDLYALEAGPHPVGRLPTLNLPDPQRNKQVPLRITWPQIEGDEPLPLIVFCHGALGSKDGYQPLVEHLASHGYAVIQPTFGDSISLMSPAEKRRYRSPVELVNSRRTLEHWDDRPRDVSFVLDRLGWIEQRARQEGMPTGGFDRGRIAVGGHSFGAHTSMLLRGLQLEARWGRSVPTFQDDRLQAAVFISPQGPSASITPASYGHLEGPLLMITGAHDGTPMKGKEDKGGDWRAQAFEHTPAGDAYLLWIEGAHHGFGGISGSRWAGAGPEAPDHVLIVKSITTAFYDAYLRGNQEAHNYLNGTKLSEETDGEAYITAK